nr:probable jasmonic acid carboxyl methyltransferase 2 [Aegilops tauschii subsp. strangulata]
MASKQMLHMNQGQEETSYARNSSAQSVEQNKMKPLIEAAILDLCSRSSTMLPTRMVIADLGCSSGPNALTLVSIAVQAIHSHYLQFVQPPPEVWVLLNDLPHNDFNTVVQSLVTLHKGNDPVVVTGVAPGLFYERLFTSGSLHLVCSSNSLHWLSKAPGVLTSNKIPAYDIDEHARLERLPIVFEAYEQQFRKDFTLFLKLRAKEQVPGGRMVISLPGRRSDQLASELCHLRETLARILRIMVIEGVIDKAKFESFYVPMHGPSDEDLRVIIQEEGSFFIGEMRVHDPRSGVDNALMVPSWFAIMMRAVFEPISVQHFGDVMDEFMACTEQRWSQPGSLEEEVAGNPLVMLVVSLTKA